MQAAHRFSFSKRRALQIACLAATLFSGQAGFALPEPEPVSALVANGKDQVEVWSQGTGRLLVMLPSAARGADDYDAAAVVLAAQGFRVLRPEPRGSGRTTGPHIGVSLQDLASDVAAVIRSENSGPAILVGHAAGSFVARMTAVEYPGLVSGVVLAAAGARNYPIELNAVVQKVGLPGLPDEERIRYLKQGFFAPGNDVTPLCASHAFQASDPTVTKNRAAACGALPSAKPSQTLSRRKRFAEQRLALRALTSAR